ncbi:MAG: 50S ribosomal protein L29 [Deltaproteobacteria bacterium]|nr:50S ribosomal protein L29 [Deltaproteobacteria bacterium]
MKASEIREMNPEERLQNLTDLKEALFNLRFQLEIGQIENPNKIKQTKNDIARLKTVIRENDN